MSSGGHQQQEQSMFDTTSEVEKEMQRANAAEERELKLKKELMNLKKEMTQQKKEIMKQNEEIMLQNEEITQQKKEIMQQNEAINAGVELARERGLNDFSGQCFRLAHLPPHPSSDYWSADFTWMDFESDLNCTADSLFEEFIAKYPNAVTREDLNDLESKREMWLKSAAYFEKFAKHRKVKKCKEADMYPGLLRHLKIIDPGFSRGCESGPDKADFVMLREEKEMRKTRNDFVTAEDLRTFCGRKDVTRKNLEPLSDPSPNQPSPMRPKAFDKNLICTVLEAKQDIPDHDIRKGESRNTCMQVLKRKMSVVYELNPDEEFKRHFPMIGFAANSKHVFPVQVGLDEEKLAHVLAASTAKVEKPIFLKVCKPLDWASRTLMLLIFIACLQRFPRVQSLPRCFFHVILDNQSESKQFPIFGLTFASHGLVYKTRFDAGHFASAKTFFRRLDDFTSSEYDIVQYLNENRCPHIIRSVAAGKERYTGFPVYFYEPYGNSIDDSNFDKALLPRIANQLFKALISMHSLGILHDDITCQNIISFEGDFYLIDFGESRCFEESNSHVRVYDWMKLLYTLHVLENPTSDLKPIDALLELERRNPEWLHSNDDLLNMIDLCIDDLTRESPDTLRYSIATITSKKQKI
jgi:hypothetical protein